MTDIDDAGPFKLPEPAAGWALSRMGDIADIVGGGTPSSKDKTNFASAGQGTAWLTPADLSGFQGIYVEHGNRDLSTKGLRESSARVMPAGTVLMSSRAPIGYLAVAKNEISTNQGFKSFILADGLVPEFVYFWLKYIAPILQELGSGSTFAEISGGRARDIPMLVAPTTEQQRIARSLEQLVAKLDSCRDRLERVPAILSRFRQAVLAAACSGRLTDEWRETSSNRGMSAHLLQEVRTKRDKALGPSKPAAPNTDVEPLFPDSWVLASMDQLTTKITSGSRDWKKYYRPDGFGTFVMAQNIRPMRYDESSRVAVAPPLNNRDAERSRVECDDILVTIVGANTGDVCRFPEARDEHFVCQSVALMRPVLRELSPFIELWLNSPQHGRAQFDAWVYGEGRPHLSFDQLRATAVALPPLEEQAEIVRRVCALLGLADSVLRRLSNVRRRHTILIEAALAKAFRGELVPTEAELAAREARAYESAEDLLKRLRASAGSEAAVPTGRAKPRGRRNGSALSSQLRERKRAV